MREGHPPLDASLLTAQDQLVLELLTEGLSNPEIASELFDTNSPSRSKIKSVENALNRIFKTLELDHLSPAGKRVKAALWWGMRHIAPWCDSCPLHPVQWQEDRVKPPMAGSAVAAYVQKVNPAKQLADRRAVGYRGLCPVCKGKVYGITGKIYCNEDCRAEFYRQKYRSRPILLGICLLPECSNEVWGYKGSNKRFCHPLHMTRNKSRVARARKREAKAQAA